MLKLMSVPHDRYEQLTSRSSSQCVEEVTQSSVSIGENRVEEVTPSSVSIGENRVEEVTPSSVSIGENRVNVDKPKIN